jgi:hypothetical protein
MPSALHLVPRYRVSAGGRALAAHQVGQSDGGGLPAAGSSGDGPAYDPTQPGASSGTSTSETNTLAPSAPASSTPATPAPVAPVAPAPAPLAPARAPGIPTWALALGAVLVTIAGYFAVRAMRSSSSSSSSKHAAATATGGSGDYFGDYGKLAGAELDAAFGDLGREMDPLGDYSGSSRAKAALALLGTVP